LQQLRVDDRNGGSGVQQELEGSAAIHKNGHDYEKASGRAEVNYRRRGWRSGFLRAYETAEHQKNKITG
jgi:hypothetical protein